MKTKKLQNFRIIIFICFHDSICDSILHNQVYNIILWETYILVYVHAKKGKLFTCLEFT